MPESNDDVLLKVVAAATKVELGSLANGFGFAVDVPNAQILLTKMPTPEDPAPRQYPVWCAYDGRQAHFLCELRLIAIRQKLEATAS